MPDKELINSIEGYIDIHCHIVPHVDDGSRSSGQTLRMIDIAYRNGIRAMIATPHYEVGKYEANHEDIEKNFFKIQRLIAERYPDFNIFLGNEIYFSYGVVDSLYEGAIYTLAGTSYVLVEFSPNDKLDYIEKSLYEIVNAGYIPILAHVERYFEVMKSHRNVERLVDEGVYIQTNASTIAGRNGRTIRKKIMKLIKKGLVHFIGTDAHSDGKRSPELEECIDYLLKKTDEDTVELLLRTNAMHVLKNEDIDEEE